MKQIIYLGKKDDYSEHLRLETEAQLTNVTIKFKDPSSLYEAYCFTLEQQPQIIIMDLDFYQRFAQHYAEQARKEIRHQVFFIVIYPSKEEAVKLGRQTALGDFIYCIRNFNVEDLINFFRNILSKKPNLKSSTKIAKLQERIILFQSMRVRFLARTYAQIETNRLFENNTEVAVKFPYFPEIFRSPKHKFMNRSSNDIHSHYHYSYQMEYQYLTQPMSSEEKQKLLNDWRYELNNQSINDELYGLIEDVLKERKSLVLAADKKTAPVNSELSEEDHSTLKKLELTGKTIYFNWLVAHTSKAYLQKENITIYDSKSNILREGTSNLLAEEVSLIHRKIIRNPAEEILSDKPAIIVVNFDQDNNVEKLQELIASSTQMRDYFPYVLVFNYKHSPDLLRDKLEYHFALVAPFAPDEAFVIKFLSIYRRKKLEKETIKSERKFQKLQDQDARFVMLDGSILFDHKVYKSINDPESLFLYPLAAEIISLSEFEIVLRTPAVLLPGETFRISKPFDMQLTVIEETAPHTYRTTIHLVNDADRYNLRTFVEEVLDLTMNNQKPLPAEELDKLKSKHFSKSSSSAF